MEQRKKSGKKPRKMWTDQQKKELIEGYEAQPANQRIAYLKEHGANGGWFYRTRKAYYRARLNAQVTPAVPTVTLQPPALRESVPAGVLNRGNVSKFATLPDADKRRLILEYKALQPEGRKLWRESHGDPGKPMTEAMAGYWMGRLLKNRRHSKLPKVTGYKRPDPDTEVRWVEEYAALPRSGNEKSVWLREHGMNHQNIFEMRRRVEMYKSKGRPNGSATTFDTALAAIPTTIEHQSPVPLTPMQEALQGLRIQRAMEEGLMALKQRRVQMDESITELERALRRAR